jgi:hypothetical protein
MKEAEIHRQLAAKSTNEQNMEHVQALILGNCRVTVADIAARLGISVARPLCKPLV